MTHTRTSAASQTQPAIQVDIHETDKTVTVTFWGELTHYTVATAYRQVEPIFKRKQPMVFDMSGVSSIDSAGLACFNCS